MSSPQPTVSGLNLDARQWRQIAGITVGALAIFAGLRLLPTGTNLSHMDFRVDAKGAHAIEFCDPLNPQFIPVVAARSPVTMEVLLAKTAAAGSPQKGVIRLATASGKPIVPEDLLVTHTRRLHLLIVDPTLADYQHLHPEPSNAAGEWTFVFTPERGGVYRFFADFTPAATGRGLYASADFEIVGGATPDRPPVVERREQKTIGDYRFQLVAAPIPVRAAQPIDLRFSVRREDGGAVPLEPVMGAFAHLVAFDQERSGFAHLHPTETELTKPPDARQPVLNFKLTIPRAGRYVVWAQLNLGGVEKFVPFDLMVE